MIVIQFHCNFRCPFSFLLHLTSLPSPFLFSLPPPTLFISTLSCYPSISSLIVTQIPLPASAPPTSAPPTSQMSSTTDAPKVVPPSVTPPTSGRAESSESEATNSKKEKAKAKTDKKGKATEGAGKKEKKGGGAGPEVRVDVSRLDLRIGRIIRAWKHPDADSLYVEEGWYLPFF